MAEFVMPSLGADMEAGTLIAWMKKPGEKINRGDIIAEIDTDKGVIEVECFTQGVIEKLLLEPGEKVPVGTSMAIICEDAEAAVVKKEPPEIAPLPPAAAPARLHISPLARKMAEELGVDPSVVTGTGPGGRITKEDIERAAASGKAVAPVVAAERQAQPGQKMRQAIAAAMTRSKREIPHYYLSTMIDMSRAMKWLEEENLRRSVVDRLLPGVLLIKAVALALRQFPDLNAFWEDDRSTPKEEIHVGAAISLRQGGLVAPALHFADRQSLSELMKNFQDLVKRARAGRLRSSELSDSTFTVTALGDQGVETVFGIIYPPQVALAGFGAIVERPWVVDGRIVARQVVNASLSADHRASDGHRGGQFLTLLDRLLQEPEKL